MGKKNSKVTALRSRQKLHQNKEKAGKKHVNTSSVYPFPVTWALALGLSGLIVGVLVGWGWGLSHTRQQAYVPVPIKIASSSTVPASSGSRAGYMPSRPQSPLSSSSSPEPLSQFQPDAPVQVIRQNGVPIALHPAERAVESPVVLASAPAVRTWDASVSIADPAGQAPAIVPLPPMRSLPLSVFPKEAEPRSLPPRGVPMWQRHAVAMPNRSMKQPMIAIVIDDMGVDRTRTQRILDLPAPLTASFLPYAGRVDAFSQKARAQGHELLVHMPMEPFKMKGNNPGPHALKVNMSSAEIRENLEIALKSFEGYVGINNHMGSRFTADAEGMRVVAEVLRERGLLFLDSVTSDASIAALTTQHYGIPTVRRSVFLDNINETSAVLRQLALVEDIARREGAAIAIGHPRDGTIAALARWLPTLEAKGYLLVPISAITRHQNPPS